MRSLRMAASWQQGVPSDGQDANASAWRFLARCADYDPDLFFPIGSSAPAVRQRMRAKAVCEQCPVRLDCLDWAVTTQQTHGVWGGLDEQERELLSGAVAQDPDREVDIRPASQEVPLARPA